MWVHILHISQLPNLIERYGTEVLWEIAKAGFWRDGDA